MLLLWGRTANLVSYFLIIYLTALLKQTTGLEKGDACVMKTEPGLCKEETRCLLLSELSKSKLITNKDVVSCGFNVHEELICCPTNPNAFAPRGRAGPSIAGSQVEERAAVIACREYDEYARSVETKFGPHILNGVPADFGEYPHMAAIGFRLNYFTTPGVTHEFRCGATLIAKRFVLTAAHCVSGVKSEPDVVRFNFTDFKDPNQNYIEIPIARNGIHLHPEYNIGSVYYDIAVLELERDVPYSKTCRPTCLYTENEVPTDQFLFAAGWGVYNTSIRSTSDILLKVGLKIQSNEACNQSFVEAGLHRRIAVGVRATQLCAHDAEKLKDSCQGDSGGPLVSVVDENLRTYRVVGVVSAGFSCASDTAGLYTRVSSFLDFVESIVWPKT